MTVRKLKNANITHVSYVDKGANQKKFFLTKSEEKPNFQKEVKVLINKEDEEQQLVYGVVYEPEVEDAHGDFMEAEDIEKAAHAFIKEYRQMDTQHDFEAGAGEVVESYVAPQDFTVGDETIAKGSWVLVTKATEEVWDAIKKGEITGYSMAGTAEVEEVEKQEQQEEQEQMKTFFRKMKEFFTGEDIIKGEVKDTFEETRKRRNFMDAYWIFDDVVFSEIHNDKPNTERIHEAALDFVQLVQEISNAPDFQKAFGEIDNTDKEVVKVNKEELQSLIKEELEPITSKLDELEKGEEDVEKAEETTEEDVEKSESKESSEDVEKAEDNKEELVKSFKEVLKEELSSIEERLDTVEKARGLSKSAEDDAEDIEKEESKQVWSSLFSIR